MIRVNELFAFDKDSPVPFYLSHGAANMRGGGFVGQHYFVPGPQPFNADLIFLTSYVSEGYKYGPDNLRHSTSGVASDSYVQDLVTEDLVDGLFPDEDFVLPQMVAPIPGYNPKLKFLVVAGFYDPCDESDVSGFPPGCFSYHHAGFHVGSGEQLVYYPPMSDGRIDIMGHCSTYETNPFILVDALRANRDNIDDDVFEAFSGITNYHPVVSSLHLCIDEDIYHPYPCNTHQGLFNATDSVVVSASPFVIQPADLKREICEERRANPDLCKFTNDTNFPFPWTQYL